MSAVFEQIPIHEPCIKPFFPSEQSSTYMRKQHVAKIVAVESASQYNGYIVGRIIWVAEWGSNHT